MIKFYIPLDIVSIPVPLQCVHTTGLYPNSQREPRHFGQISTTFIFISLFTPRAACSNVILTTIYTKIKNNFKSLI